MQDERVFEAETTPEYEAFVEKFKPKKTTDDCYTPPLVYDAIKKWACAEYGIDPDKIVRPFYPGGDYEHFEYPHGCVVLDNPPFSILTKICAFYLDRGIDFFLFAPSLTALSGANVVRRMCHIICDSNIVYENGAKVRTAFVTSFGGDVIIRTAPRLGELIDAAVAETLAANKKTLPKYQYPHEVLTTTMMQKLSKYGVDFEVRRGECMPIRKLDQQYGKAIFGGGLLLSEAATRRRAAAERAAAERAAAERAAAERAAAERAAAERAAAKVWELSEREKLIVKSMSGDGTIAE